MKCKKCGYENREENNYCANCGAKLNSGVNVEKKGTEISHQTKIVLAVMISVAIFSLMEIGIWWSTLHSAPGMSEATFTFVVESDTEWSGAFGTLKRAKEPNLDMGVQVLHFTDHLLQLVFKK